LLELCASMCLVKDMHVCVHVFDVSVHITVVHVIIIPVHCIQILQGVNKPSSVLP